MHEPADTGAAEVNTAVSACLQTHKNLEDRRVSFTDLISIPACLDRIGPGEKGPLK